MRANVKCLLERLLLVGEGQGQAVGKERGGEGKIGQGGALAGESHRQEPVQEG